jgi:predicted  nucleic acid-binding Zn-ribbon protein
MAVEFRGEISDINDAEQIRRLKKKLTVKDLEIADKARQINDLRGAMDTLINQYAVEKAELDIAMKELKEKNQVLRRDLAQVRNSMKRTAET